MKENAKVVAKVPQMIDLEADKNYAWCACGHSTGQPWCDGSHRNTEFTPAVFSVEDAKKGAICMCKQTSTPPYCDGSHRNLG